jgi:D-aspartate ligase
VTGRPGAVVVGGDYQGLAIVRSLGRRGIDAIVLDDERSISRYSRYAPRFHRVPDLRDEERTVAALLDLGRRCALDGWVVFPTREETVAALSRNRERLLAQYRIPTPAWSVVKWAWDKRNTYSRAAELGMAVPRTWTLRDAGGLSSIDGDPPYVIKPAIKEHFFYKTGHKAWRADTRAELESHVRRAQGLIGVSEVLVQELIPGSGDCQLAYCAFFKDGEAHAKMTVRRARQHPAEFGRASTFVETIDAPELEEPSERFLRSIGYYGLVELEYKRDPRDGVTKLLDVNARTWGYHGLGQQAGIDFPAYLYYDQIGSPLAGAATARARAGATWIRLSTDLPTAILEIARGSLDWREFIRSVRAADVGAVLARDDPRPALAELALLPYLAVKRGF